MVIGGPSLDPVLIADVLGDDNPITLRKVQSQVETTFSIVDTRHPAFQVFGDLVGTFAQVSVRESFHLLETEEIEALARYEDGATALAEYSSGNGRVLVFASDLNNSWNDFPLKPTFVPFVYELMQYLIGEHSHEREFTVDDVPVGVDQVPGFTVIPDDGRQVVVNVDSRESNTDFITTQEFENELRKSQTTDDGLRSISPIGSEHEDVQSYWWYLILLMVVVLIGEAWLARSMA